MPVLSIKNLSFAYEKINVLENISLEVEEKDFLAIIGPNGGGKSTLLKLILGIINKKESNIKINNNLNQEKISNIGYVPQNTNINTDFPIKVLEVVMMGHSTKNKPSIFSFGYTKEEKSCAINSLRQVGMENFANKKIGNLSGGQRQRVMIARALCSNPKILILDEPTASIDVDGQKQIYELLKELNKNITIIVVSHDISVILHYANKVAHINKKLTFHNLNIQKNNIKKDKEHFCEVEMLQMLGECQC
jgi:zinc transport system ATP-binding protein